MGGTLSGKPSECWQAAQWQTNQRQPLPAFCSDTSCLGSDAYEWQLLVRPVSPSQATPGCEESGNRNCPQCAGDRLPCACQKRTVSGSWARLLPQARQGTASTTLCPPFR